MPRKLIQSPAQAPALSPKASRTPAVTPTATPAVTPTAKDRMLRRLLESPTLEFLLEAHNGLSAKLVERAGFKGIWASSLALSAQFGVRDCNEASWTQVVDMLEFMVDATRIPILLDGDTGYGNFNNLRRLVRKLEQRSVAGVTIEDKLFPKSNSLLPGHRQQLAPIDEFCGKIKAGKDSQQSEDFCIIARVEALIAGWGIAEALRRAEAYHAAGADAILIHSRRTRGDEILEFARAWAGRCPLVIVPTTYHGTPTELFRQAGIGLVIWANHLLRAAVDAMEHIASELQCNETAAEVEDDIAPLEHIFELQETHELRRAESRYLAGKSGSTNAVILAATRGTDLRELTHKRPKAMLPVNGIPILERLVQTFRRQDVRRIGVVTGYQAAAIDLPDLEFYPNPEYGNSGELSSLLCAEPCFQEDLVVAYGDLLFRGYILRELLESPEPLTIVVDSTPPPEGATDYAYCSRPDDRTLFGAMPTLRQVTPTPLQGEAPMGRWIGLLRAHGVGLDWLRESLAARRGQEDFARLHVPDLLNDLVKSGRVPHVQYIRGHWLNVNTLTDLERAGAFAHRAGDTRRTSR